MTSLVLELQANRILNEAKSRSVAFMMEFAAQPEHVAVIVSTSKMDELLSFGLRKRLLPNPGKKDELLDSERGLGTFSNKIDLSYRLGIISADLSRALHLFRKIRNDFAHAYEGQVLSSSPHKDRVDQLNIYLETHIKIEELKAGIRKIPEINEVKISFVAAAVLAITKLELVKVLIKTVDAKAATYAKYP